MEQWETGNAPPEEIKNKSEICHPEDYNFHTNSSLGQWEEKIAPPEEIKNEREICHPENYSSETFNSIDWRIKISKPLPKSPNYQTIVEKNLELIEIFADMTPSFKKDLEKHQKFIYSYPNEILILFNDIIRNFLSKHFALFEQDHVEFVNHVKNFRLENILSINEKSVLPEKIESCLSEHLRSSDFYSVFWFYLMLLEKSLTSFLQNELPKKIMMQNYTFVQRLSNNFIKIISLLRIMGISAETNEFCFNYVALVVLNFFILISPLKASNEEFGIILTRIDLVNGSLSGKIPTQKKYKKTIKLINNNFKKIELGKAYFEIWENLCLAGTDVLCELIHPELEPANFTQENFNETTTPSKIILNTAKNNMYSYDCVPETDAAALTLVNNSIGFHYSIIEKAIVNIKGKLELIISGFHELGHMMNSYKKQNYLIMTQKKINFKSGNFLQINGKHDFSKIDEKGITEALLFLMKNSYSKNDLKKKLNPINFHIKEFDQDKVQKENLMNVLKKMYEKNIDKHECAYSELRNTFLNGVWKLYEKKD